MPKFLLLTLKGAIIMSKKWLLTSLSGTLLSAMIVTGCADDQDPAPPTDTNQEDPTENNGSQEVDEHNDESMNNEEGTNGTEQETDKGIKENENEKE
jgi:PBP1b-binding outer membrane lipoprotein LpoB